MTIADVAREAGVSASTVSYVMSGKRTISVETRDRVERAISSLGYSPHAGARSLASRSTDVIGLQAPLRAGVDVHVVMQIVTGVVQRARVHGYDILLLASDDADGLARAARGSKVDALLLMDVESHDSRLATLATLEQPAVLIGLPAGRRSLPCVDFDFEAAGWLAVERLAGEGRRRLALLGAPAEVMARHTSYADRLARGFADACASRDIVGATYACPSSADAVAVVDQALASDPGLAGMVVHNEAALPHVVDRLAAVRAETGRDVALIAISADDDERVSAYALDTIAMPAAAMGEAAADVVCEILAGTARPSVHLLPPVLASEAGTPSV